MKFRVYETKTGRDVTDERDWFIDEDGFLWYRTCIIISSKLKLSE